MSSRDPEPSDPLQDVSLNMEISRGSQPEFTFNFNEVKDLSVYDENDKKIKFGDLYKDKKTIIIFMRHFLCFAYKEYVEDLAVIPESYLRESDVRLVVIGCGPSKFIQPFRDATGFRGLLFVDPDRQIFTKLDLHTGINSKSNIKDSKHVKSGMFMGILKSTWRGMKFCEMQGDARQQGGAFILGPGEEVHYVHKDENPTHHTAINDLLGLAGVAQVNYDNDKRVMVI